MKSLTLQEKIGAGLVVGSVSFLILDEWFGTEIAVGIFQWGWIMAVVSYGVNWIYDACENHEYRSKIRRRTLRKIDRRIEAMNFLRAENGVGFWSLDIRDGQSRADFVSPKGPKVVTYNGAKANAEAVGGPMPSALALLRDVSCGLICGGRGAGKTELVRHIAAERAARGWFVVLIDPKPRQAGKWPGCKAVGCGNDYGAIGAELAVLSSSMGRSRGNVLVIIDEMTRLNLRIPNFTDLWLPLLLEGREYGIDVWIIGQSKTAASIGLSGKYDLLECFDAVATAKRDKSERWVEVETQGQKEAISAAHPGPMVAHRHPAADDGVIEAEWTEAADGPGGAENAADASGGSGALGKIAGLIGFTRRPDSLTEQRAEIWEALYRSGGSRTAKELEAATKMKGSYIRKTLSRMVQDGLLEKEGRGKYRLPSE
ncbi:MAG: hypothetical protein ACLFRG_22815 [Desulfococcaceae bacterium]